MTRHCLKASWCSVMRMALEELFLCNRCTGIVKKKKTSIFRSCLLTVVPVPEVVCVADGVDGKVVDDTARGHIRVSLRVDVGVTFPRLPGPEL